MTPDEHLDAYAEKIRAASTDTWAVVFCLGALASAAAAWGEIRDAPDAWEWPSATEGFNGE